MPKQIVNRVANSKLITIDLEDFYPKGERIIFDIKKWLFAEQILKEQDFREYVKNENWNEYNNKYVALTCSSDAIIPSWAYMLLTVALTPFAKLVVVGGLKDLETAIFQNVIDEIPLEEYKGKPLIVKGCSDIDIPETAYSLLIHRLIPVARSIMYGEACSSVPLYKKTRV